MEQPLVVAPLPPVHVQPLQRRAALVHALERRQRVPGAHAPVALRDPARQRRQRHARRRRRPRRPHPLQQRTRLCERVGVALAEGVWGREVCGGRGGGHCAYGCNNRGWETCARLH